jgi:hypothetical protein
MTFPAKILRWMLFASLLLVPGILLQAQEEPFNTPSNILIADQFNNRVIEVDRRGNIVWHFGLGPADFSPASIIGTNDAQRVGELTLMAGTGTPGGQPEAPNCTNPSGCPDNRVLLVDRNGNIVWQYGQFGVSGSGPDQLNVPVQNTWLPNRHVLITDQANERIIEVDVASKGIVWQYGTTGVSGNGPNQLNNPNCAELLENGHILICDENNNRAIEVTRKLPLGGDIVWQYGSGDPNINEPVSGVAFASRLKNGNTLITDSNHSRIVEIDQAKNVVWEYFTCAPGCTLPRGTGPLPTRAVRLRHGHTLISDQYHHRVIEVNHAKQIVRTYGRLNSLGYNTESVADGGLNSPYDAKRIGDYTGLTPPFDFRGEGDE